MIEIDLFIPCFIDQLYPETGWNMVKVLRKVGCKVNYNPGQTCCGQPALNAGHYEEAKSVAKKFIGDFEGNRLIVSPSASCISMIRTYYDEFFHNSSLHNKSRSTKKRAVEFLQFLGEYFPDAKIPSQFSGKVAYMDSCSALRGLDIYDTPRNFLKKIPGITLLEMEDADVCCGFGGTFAVKHSEISGEMAAKKTDHALASGAEYITSTDLSCLMHIEHYIKKNNISLQTLHIADIMAKGL